MKSFGVNDGVNALSVDEIAIIFSYLPPTDILRARVCTSWRDAAKKTTAPLYDFKERYEILQPDESIDHSVAKFAGTVDQYTR